MSLRPIFRVKRTHIIFTLRATKNWNTRRTEWNKRIKKVQSLFHTIFFALFLSVCSFFSINSDTWFLWRARIGTDEWIEWWIKWEKDPESRSLVFKLVGKWEFLTNLCNFHQQILSFWPLFGEYRVFASTTMNLWKKIGK